MIYKFNRQAFNRPAGTTGYVQLVVRGESSIKIGVQVVRGVSCDVISLSNVEMSVLRTALPFIEFASRSEMRGSVLRTSLPFIVFTSKSEMRSSLLRTALPFIGFTSKSEMISSLLRTALPFIGFTSKSEMRGSLLRGRCMVLNTTSTSQFRITAYGLMSVRTSYLGASSILQDILRNRYAKITYDALSAAVLNKTIVRFVDAAFTGKSTIGFTVVPALNELINGSSRQFAARVEIYFDGIDAAPLVIRDYDNLVSFSLLEELRATTDNPLGDLTANELDLNIFNDNHRFSPTHMSSDLYGKLLPGVPLKPYLSLIWRNNVIHDFGLGTFYSGDWNAAASSVTCNTVCYDRMRDIMKIPFEGLRVLRNVTYIQLFEILFAAAKLTPAEYNIDASLDIVVDIAHIPGDTIGKALKYVAEACGSFILVDRDNVVQVLKIDFDAAPVAELTEPTQLIDHSQPTRYLEMYTALKVPYYKTTISDEVLLMQVLDLELEPGDDSSAHALRQIPVEQITKIELIGHKDVRLRYYTYTAEQITLYTSNNTTEVQKATLRVYGQSVDYTAETIEREYPAISKIMDKKDYTIDNKLIQTEAVSNSLIDLLERVTSNPSAAIKADIRGNPRITPGSIVVISDEGECLPLQRVLVSASNLRYDGAVSGNMEGYTVEVKNND